MAYANMRADMPCWTKIYAIFFGTITERDFRKKIPKHKNIYKWCNAVLGIFSAKRARYGPAFSIFFQDSWIRVKKRPGLRNVRFFNVILIIIPIPITLWDRGGRFRVAFDCMMVWKFENFVRFIPFITESYATSWKHPSDLCRRTEFTNIFKELEVNIFA